MTPADVLRTEEWNLLKQQFDELVHDESVAADSIEKIFECDGHHQMVLFPKSPIFR
jgi:hypothetical protein